MNLTSEESEASNGVLFVNFNQSSTSLSVGTKRGYKLHDLQDFLRFETVHECAVKEDVCIVERHFLTSLVGIVSLSSPRKLTFYNFSNGAEISVKHFPNTILSLKLNRKTFVVCLEESLHIHDIMIMTSLHTITNTPPNPSGLCSLSVNNAHGFLAYPGSSSVGDVQIFDVCTLQPKITISAHNSPLAALTFNEDGSMIATASIKGTVIRVFDVTTGTILFDFRRGVKRCATIYSLSFSSGSEFLCASSNTETVHVFRLSVPENNEIEITDDSEGWINMFGKLLTTSAQYLPGQMSEIFTQQRSFATVQLPFSGLRNISSIALIQNVPHVIIVSADRFVYIYSVTSEETTGTCSLVKQHRIDGSVKATGSPVIRSSPLSLKTSTAASIPSTAPTISLSQDSIHQSEEKETKEENGESGDFTSTSYTFKLPYDCEFPPVPYKVD